MLPPDENDFAMVFAKLLALYQELVAEQTTCARQAPDPKAWVRGVDDKSGKSGRRIRKEGLRSCIFSGTVI